MSEAIVITSGKGGVGKTTTCANIGIKIANRGKKVVMVDGDTGLRNLDLILGLENRIVFTYLDVLQGKCALKHALIRDKRIPHLFLLPTDQMGDKSDVKPENMIYLVNELKKQFDYILIDCPAGIEQGFESSAAGADRALIVVNPELSSIRDADRIISKLNSKGIKRQELIINMIDPVMVRSGHMLDVKTILEALVIKPIGIVPNDRTVTVSINRGEPLILDSESKVSIAFKNIADRIIINETIPISELNGLVSDSGILTILRGYSQRAKKILNGFPSS